MRITILLGDPWDLGESLSWQPIRGELLQREADDHGGSAFIKLENPIHYRNTTWNYVVASPRYRGRSITELLTGDRVTCAFIGISDEQAMSDKRMDTSKWRGGGLAFVGDISFADQ